MADNVPSRTEQLQYLAWRWQWRVLHPVSAFLDWFTPRFRPEAFRQQMMLDTEGPVITFSRGKPLEHQATPSGQTQPLTCQETPFKQTAAEELAMVKRTLARMREDHGPLPTASLPPTLREQQPTARLFSAMHAGQHEDWTRGGTEASEVELRSWEAAQQAEITGRVDVRTPAGETAFQLDMPAQQPTERLFYSMSGPQYDVWQLGGEERATVERTIRDDMQRTGDTGTLEVLTPYDAPAFRIDLGAPQPLTQEPPRSLLEQIESLRDRLDASTQSLETPQQPRQQGQGMGG